MERLKKYVIIILVLFVSFGLIAETVSKITDKEVEQYKNKKLFIIRYSNIIYEQDGKNIKIPIFQGVYGDVLYNDFYDYCIQKKYFTSEYKESGFIIKTKKGELRKTFHNFLNFYKSNILKDIDINKPTKMDCDGFEWWIDYDFTVNNVPCYISIRISSSEEDNVNFQKYKSPYEIKTNETKEDSRFTFSIYIGTTSINKFDSKKNKTN